MSHLRLAALIGETSVVPVLEAISSIPDMQLSAVWTSNRQLHERVRLLDDRIRLVEHWDGLLVEPLDAVIVAGASPELLTGARQFLHQGLTVLVATEIAAGPEKLFEFMPLWQEFPGQVSPLFCSGVETLAQQLWHQFTHSDNGEFWKLEFHRVLNLRAFHKAETATTPAASEQSVSPGFTAAMIDQTLLQDLKWMCRLTGKPRHVTMQVSGPAGCPAEVTVLLGGEKFALKSEITGRETYCEQADEPATNTREPARPEWSHHGGWESRWVLHAHNGPECWDLKLIGIRGTVSLRCEGNQYRIESAEPAGPANHDGTAPTMLKVLRQNTRTADAVQQLLDWQQARSDQRPGQSWREVIQLAEIGAAARRSLLRRRTIDVHFEEASERSQFKTQMTAMGCGALLWTMFGMVTMLTFAGIFDPRDREYRQSAAARFVIHQEDFSPASDMLTPLGEEKLRQLAARWSSTSPVLIIEKTSEVDSPLNGQREQVVLTQLQQAGVRAPEERTILRTLNGKWFETLLIAGWVVVFCPLAIVLLLQFLILVSREPKVSADENDG